jgi:hypothetical protein
MLAAGADNLEPAHNGPRSRNRPIWLGSGNGRHLAISHLRAAGE